MLGLSAPESLLMYSQSGSKSPSGMGYELKLDVQEEPERVSQAPSPTGEGDTTRGKMRRSPKGRGCNRWSRLREAM